MWRGAKYKRRLRPEPIEPDKKLRAEIKAKIDDVADYFKYRPINRNGLAIICAGLQTPNRANLEAAESLVAQHIAAERNRR